MKAITVRPGQPDDIPAVMQLIRELAEYEKAAHEVILDEAQLRADGFGQQALYGLLVAEEAGELVGLALYFYRYSTWKGKLLYLEDFYIRPHFRRRGLGQAFFRALAQIAHREQCARIFWQVLDWNTEAQAFYQKMGARFDGGWLNGYLERAEIDLLRQGPASFS
ncbi:MAG: GNAT family N-acetyltransferase [Microscillaceae bacterium]